MMELSLLGLVVAGYAGSMYWTSYLRALGQAADHCHANRQDLAMNRLKIAVLLPPFGQLVDQWALCLNFQSYLYIKQNQPDWAEKRLTLIEKRGGICDAVRSLCFYRRAEINELRGFPNEARACREQALERFRAAEKELHSRELWRPLSLVFYGTGDYAAAADSLEHLLKREWSAPLLFLRWLSLELAGAPKERTLAACREALRYETLPARRACLLATAAGADLEDNPESALAASQACLDEQDRLGNLANPELTAWAMCSRLAALGRLDREPEYRRARDEFFQRVDRRSPGQLSALAVVLLREGRIRECLHLTESSHEASVRAQRMVALAHLGRPKDALDCCPGEERWSTAETVADCYLSLFDRDEAYRAIECLREQDRTAYLKWRAEKASIWDGEVALAQELWPHPYLDSTLLMFQGRFKECWEAWSSQWERSATAPPVRVRGRLYFQAVLWMYEECWEQARENFEKLSESGCEDTRRLDYIALYTLTCRCWLGKDCHSELESLGALWRERYAQSPLIQADFALNTADCLLGLGRYEECLQQVDTSLPGEPRAFYRAFLLDLKSLSLRATGRESEAEKEDRTILSVAPESFWSMRARARLQLPS